MIFWKETTINLRAEKNEATTMMALKRGDYIKIQMFTLVWEGPWYFFRVLNVRKNLEGKNVSPKSILVDVVLLETLEEYFEAGSEMTIKIDEQGGVSSRGLAFSRVERATRRKVEKRLKAHQHTLEKRKRETAQCAEHHETLMDKLLCSPEEFETFVPEKKVSPRANAEHTGQELLRRKSL